MNCPFFVKQCTICGRILIACKNNFKKAKNGKYGFYARCKECEKIIRKDNEEYFIKYREEHRKEHREYAKQHYIDNSEIYKERAKIQRERNKDFIAQYKKEWAKENEAHLKEYKHIHYEENKECYLTSGYNRRLREENQGNGITKEQFKEVIAFFDYKCAYSGESFKQNINNKKRTLDHIIPLINNGENEIWNMVPMCSGYNSAKRDKNMLEWYKQQEFYSEERLQKIYEWQKYAYEKWGE